MRKLTGYIGAMIIVFALMGSVLAGYALNVNGESAVINEYDHVTDVSGLYSYSEEKTYIDYNPASNYTNYQLNEPTQYDNPIGQMTFKKITSGTITLKANKHVLIDGVDQGAPSKTIGFFCSKCYLSFENNRWYQYPTGGTAILNTANDVTITVNGGNATITGFGSTVTWSNIGLSVAYSTIDYDYYYIDNPQSPVDLYLYEKKDVLILTQSTLGIYNYNTWRAVQTANTATVDYFGNGTQITEDITQYTVNTTLAQGYLLVIFYPTSVFDNKGSLGVDYAVSNRVNNYPVVTDPGNVTHITNQVNLTSISASDYWNRFNIPNTQSKVYYIVMTTPEHNDLDFSDDTAGYIEGPWYKSDGTIDHNTVTTPHYYRLIDILNTLNIPPGVSSVKITTNSNDLRNENVAGYYSTTNWQFDANLAFISTNDDWVFQRFGFNTNTAVVGAGAGTKDYAIYNINNSTIDVYNSAGVKKSTKSIDDVYIGFISGGTNYGYAVDTFSGLNNSGVLPMANRPTPFITLDYDVVNGESIEYLDITKGFVIDPTNNYDTIWNNEYENGLIQILFRASSLDQTYHNELTVNSDVINVDFTNNRFYVTLNNGDSVDIGTWRNIILNIDLINGSLSATPVRTFNNFTNVRLDNTNIEIGNISATPTNFIKWSDTNNSLIFNVYQTSVFMNTYGVVMANPSINITNYFTNLDNFYELKLTNFSIFGDSITVNGQTFPVDENIITVGNETLIIKDLSIMYADGHAYLADSHITIDIGEITDNVVSMTGAWYFQTELLKGSTAQKMIYEWDWQGFVFDNTEFCIFYIGLAVAALLIARRFCQLSIIDYSIFIVSIIIALSVQVIA